MNRFCFITIFITMAGAFVFGQTTNTVKTCALMPDTGYGTQTYIPLSKSGEASELIFGANATKINFKLSDGKVTVDLNDDGKFDAVKNDSISIPVMIGGQKVDYPIRIQSHRTKWLILHGQLSLKADIDGAIYRMIDSNFNGVFGEIGADSLIVGKQQYPLSEVFSTDDGLYNIKVLDGGTQLRVAPYNGPTSRLTISAMNNWGISLTLKESTHKFQTNINGEKAINLLPGTYNIERVYIGTPANAIYATNKRPSSYIYGSRRDGSTMLTIKAGQNRLKFGAPFKLDAKITSLSDDGSKIKINSVKLTGIAGEAYRAELREKGVKSRLECWVRADKQEKLLSSMEYG